MKHHSRVLGNGRKRIELMNKVIEITVIVPIFNESDVIPEYSEAITSIIEELPSRYSFRFLFVDDGSTDNSVDAIKGSFSHSTYTVLSFSRNFGKEAALSAGIDHASGDVVIIMDVDLQDPPNLIPKFLAEWEAGYKVVYGVRSNRERDSWLKRKSALKFYGLFNKLSDIKIPTNAGDYRLLDRTVIAALRALTERNRFTKGLYAWAGFKSKGISYVRPERKAGYSKWSYWKLWNLAIDGIFSFSSKPLRVFAYTGAIVSFSSIIYAVQTVIRVFFFDTEVRGYASLITAITFLGGLQLLMLGIFGEYLAKVFVEIKGRPNYIIANEQHSKPDAPKPIF